MSDNPIQELDAKQIRIRTATLLFSIMVIAINGVIYELLIGGYSSYLLGDSITQFSLTIGVFMSSMGLGSWLTQLLDKDLEIRFIEVELVLAFLGGPAILILAMAHIYTRVYSWMMFAIIICLGTCIGFEIPLVTRMVNRYGTLKEALANVLSFDYIGALFGSLIFPLFLLPELGFVRTSFVIGLVSLVVGMLNLVVLRDDLGNRRWYLWGASFVIGVFLGVGVLFSPSWIKKAREKASGEKVVYFSHSPYQTIRFVKTKNPQGKEIHRLYINAEHQFSTDTERRYHELLVHPAMSAAKKRRRILVLGGGDGLVLREIWKYTEVKDVVLVDLDPTMTTWAKHSHLMQKLHQNAFRDSRLKILHQDAYLFVQKVQKPFDVVIMDLPTPTNIALSRLYSLTFFRYLRRIVQKDGAFVTEAAVLDAVEKKPFWCIEQTIETASWKTYPYHSHSMAFLLASHRTMSLDPSALKLGTNETSYLTTNVMRQAFVLPRDVFVTGTVPVNTLDTHALLQFVMSMR